MTRFRHQDDYQWDMMHGLSFPITTPVEYNKDTTKASHVTFRKDVYHEKDK